MTQIYTILFDLDGTIVNTAPDLMAAHNHVMKKFGHAEKKLSDIKSLAGKGAWVMMQRSFKEEIKDEKIKKEMTKEFLDYYSKNIDQNSQPLKGSIEFLNWAKKSNKTKNDIINIMKNQASSDERMSIADEVIKNDSSLDDLKKQVIKVHQKLLGINIDD